MRFLSALLALSLAFGPVAPAWAVDPKQAEYYEAASKDADKAAKAADMSSKLWMAVSAVCVPACVASLTGVGGVVSYVCTGASVAGSVAEAVITKDFMSSMSTLPLEGAGLALSLASGPSAAATEAATAAASAQQAAQAAAQAAEAAKAAAAAAQAAVPVGQAATQASMAAQATANAAQGTADAAAKTAADATAKAAAEAGSSTTMQKITACLGAAMAVAKAVMKTQAAKEAKKNANENGSMLAKLKSDAAVQGTAPSLNTGEAGSVAAGMNTSMGSGGGGKGDLASDAGGSASSPCSGTSGGAMVSCALAQDSNLPRGLDSPDFAKAFEKASGKSLSDFMNTSNSGAAQMMAGAMLGGGQFNGEQAQHLVAALKKAESGYADLGSSEGTAYASGGAGGGAPAGGPAGKSVDDLLEKVMGQLMPKEAVEEAPPGVRAVAFAHKQRGPASLSEDRRLSLFDRVTYRYLLVKPRVGQAATASVRQ